MAAKKNPLSDKAYEMYKQGVKLVDIAAALDVPPGTVRRWKSTYGWDSERSDKQSERSIKKRTEMKPVIDDGTKETLQNDDLTPEQQMFCIYYSRTFNATQSYLKAYGCSYETAMVNGLRLLRNARVKEEIERLKEIKRQQIVVGSEDIVELQMRIAFADFRDIADYDATRITPKDSKSVDTQLIKKVKETQYGISIEVEDRQKAIDWLTKYFLMHPESKYKAEYERKRAEVKDNAGEEILKNMQTIADILRSPVPNRVIEDFEDNRNE